jgi:hypothetical protein
MLSSMPTIQQPGQEIAEPQAAAPGKAGEPSANGMAPLATHDTGKGARRASRHSAQSATAPATDTLLPDLPVPMVQPQPAALPTAAHAAPVQAASGAQRQPQGDASPPSSSSSSDGPPAGIQAMRPMAMSETDAETGEATHAAGPFIAMPVLAVQPGADPPPAAAGRASSMAGVPHPAPGSIGAAAGVHPASPGQPAASAPGAAQSPVAQLLPAIALAVARGGTQSVTVALHPAELGAVQLRIEQPADGPARVTLAAERPDTLLALQQNRSQLDIALDNAGLPAHARSVSFEMMPAAGSAPGPAPTAATPDGGAGFGQAAGDQQGRSPDEASGQARAGPTASGATTDDEPPDAAAAPTARAWRPFGVDITA